MGTQAKRRKRRSTSKPLWPLDASFVESITAYEAQRRFFTSTGLGCQKSPDGSKSYQSAQDTTGSEGPATTCPLVDGLRVSDLNPIFCLQCGYCSKE